MSAERERELKTYFAAKMAERDARLARPDYFAGDLPPRRTAGNMPPDLAAYLADMTHEREAEDLRRSAASVPLHRFDRGLITVGELAVELAEIHQRIR